MHQLNGNPVIQDLTSSMKNNLRTLMLDTAAMELDFPVTDADLDEMAREVDAISDEHWYWCTFRESYLICLYGNQDVNDKKNMDWLPYAKNCKKLIALCEDFIFPMTDVRPRIIIIRTMPGMKMRLHTDCYRKELEILEPKLRLILKGRENNTLFYMDEEGNKIHIPDSWRGYIMSGAALHGMDNIGEEKYTLCWGDPWTGDDLKNEKFVRYMSDQYLKHYDELITISELGNVDHASGIKDPTVEKIYSWNDWNENRKT